MINNYPYSDEYMTYDYENHRYMLTEKAILDELGINLSERSKNEAAKKAFLRLASNQIYNFIHSHNVNNVLQDYIIAKTAKGRKIIKEAMTSQFWLLANAGDLSILPDERQRALSIDMNAISVLEQSIPEIGCSILYTGNLPRICLKGEW
jgi:hypothetical protein